MTTPTKEHKTMPTQATVDRWKRRAEQAEEGWTQERRLRDAAEAEQAVTEGQLADMRKRVDGLVEDLLDIDVEARLVADLEAAVTAYEGRLREAADRARAANPNQYAMSAGWDGPPRREPYRPATESALGRSLLHVAQRHDVPIEATVVYPEPAGPTLVSAPPELATAIERMVEQDGWRR